jgi:RES domain-containing protein
MRAYRLCGRNRDPRDATGALRRGGRWNSPGIAVLYCSSSLSLACLEALVHIRVPTNLPPYIYVEVSIPDEHIRPWNNFEGRGRAILESLVLSREIGDEWVNDRPDPLSERRAAEAVLQVPSVVIPQEWINPESPDFRDVVWSRPAPFNIDPRLLWPALR